jgi:uncharacterized protein YigE (DUF2233 family)
MIRIPRSLLAAGVSAAIPLLALAQSSAPRPPAQFRPSATLAPAVTHFPITPPGRGGTIEVAVATAVPGLSEVSLLFVPQSGGSPAGAARSVRELAAGDLVTRGSEPRKAIVSGGFSSSRLEIPLGLLVVDGRTVSDLNRAKARPIAGCEQFYEELRFSGLLCQEAATGRWSILRAQGYAPNMCRQALQAGPIVVRDGRNAVCANEPQQRQPYDRMIACVTAGHTLKFIHSGAVNLHPLAEWLAAPEPNGGGCAMALNLAGDSSAGIAYYDARANPRLQHFGSGSFPLPSAFVIRWR